jgi:oxygen-independent coproporphyrinogen-3 oxidase
VNVYLHIPFCSSLCSYCDFTSFSGREAFLTEYAQALQAEIEASDVHGPLRTVYWGGGTPSILDPDLMGGVMRTLERKVGFSPDVEVSMEANPDSLTAVRLQGYRGAGVNRLSLGAQAAQDHLLAGIGRRHDSSAIGRAVREARAVGFSNLNLDVMFGLPKQSLADLEETLERFLALEPTHLSLYALQVEEGTPLAAKVAAGLPIPDDDEQADQYAAAQRLLEGRGWSQYEVSNFAREGYECKHNLAVWRGGDYFGFGVSAVGTVGLERRTETEFLESYLVQAREGVFHARVETLAREDREREKVLLALRTSEGTSREALARTGADKNAMENLLAEGWLQEREGRVGPSSKAYFVLHSILRRLFP